MISEQAKIEDYSTEGALWIAAVALVSYSREMVLAGSPGNIVRVYRICDRLASPHHTFSYVVDKSDNRSSFVHKFS